MAMKTPVRVPLASVRYLRSILQVALQRRDFVDERLQLGIGERILLGLIVNRKQVNFGRDGDYTRNDSRAAAFALAFAGDAQADFVAVTAQARALLWVSL